MALNDSKQVHWAEMKEDERCSSSDSLPSSDFSSDLTDDASSSSSSSSSINCNGSSSGPLFELAADLMAQLPIKRGLSKFYDGKSKTFASLSNLKSGEELVKRESGCGGRMKSCKSYGGTLNSNHQKFGPKATIAKRNTKASCSSSFAARSSLFMNIHG